MNDHARRRFLQFLAASPLLTGGAMAQEKPALITAAGQALSVFELEAVAETKVPPAHWGYLMTGVLDDRTRDANAAAYGKWGMRARRLVSAGKPDLSVRLLGETWASPVLLCPLGSQRAFHPDGELASARAAKARGALQVLSTVASTGVADVVRERAGPIWFQVYPTDDLEVAKGLVRKADAAGASAIVLTLDLLDGPGRRETLQRLMRADTRQCAACHTTPRGPGPMESMRRPNFAGLDISRVRTSQGALTWDYVSRMREATKKPVLVKGIMTGEDAKIALGRGVSGIWVSNHGGRAEESLVPTLDALAEVRAAVGPKVPVIVDGGIRRGVDVYKARALGADMVGIGRPYIWGLGAFGQAGVEAAMRLIDEELDQAMRETGVARLADIKRANLQRLA
jgi:4-hydroxymandelate oxidase